MINLGTLTLIDGLYYLPYRKAHIVHPVLEIEDEGVDVIQKELCEKSGVDPDNHTCCMIGSTPIEFSDGKMLVGGELVLDK